MQYNDTRLQYDQINVNYDGSWALDLSETVTHSESISKNIQKTISEIATHSEVISKLIQKTIEEVSTYTETISKTIQTTITEVATHSESYVRMIAKTISETVTHSETQFRMISIMISETVSYVESLIPNILGRLSGVIGMIKEFVRIGDKKEKISVINVGEGIREQLNVIERQFDDATVLYDNPSVCYNNYISSEKPIFKLSKQNKTVSVALQKDKPSVSKK